MQLTQSLVESVHAALQARELHCNCDGLTKTPDESEPHEVTPADKELPTQQETVQHAAEAVWSTMVHKLIQREARSKKFDEIWPQVVKSLILKGFSGVY